MEDDLQREPLTLAVSLALQETRDPRMRSDLLFLEAWEMQRPADLGATLRASQIRRANPDLVEAIEQELKTLRRRAGDQTREAASGGASLTNSGPVLIQP
jgi:hypothetical protein